MADSYDAVVVGSGFGGGVAACRLTAAGWKVCVLERGRRFSGSDFPEDPDQAPLALWHPRVNPGGLYDVRIMRDVATVTAAGVGGGSLVYANVQLRAPADVFTNGWPAAITRPDLDRWYDRTEEALQPVETPSEPALHKVRAFSAMAANAGMEGRRLPIAVHFGEAHRHPFSGVHQSGCRNLGRCVLGCPIGAKNSIDLTYLARAERDGAHTRPMCDAERIDPPRSPGGSWIVGYCHRHYRTRGTVRGRVLILAAGTLGTTRLLLRNRRRLKRLSAALGSRYSATATRSAWHSTPGRRKSRAREKAWGRQGLGPTMTSFVDRTADRGLMVADGGLPAAWSGILAVLRHYDALTGWRRRVVQLRDIGTRLGFTDQPLRPVELRLARRAPSRTPCCS